MPSILFVCTANLLRSPIAAATFKQHLAEPARKKWRVESAGTWIEPGQAVPRQLGRLGAKLGVDLAGHVTRSVDELDLAGFDTIVTMEDGHSESLGAEFPHLRQRIHLLTELAGTFPSDIPDPAMKDEQGALTLLREMQALVIRVAARLVG